MGSGRKVVWLPYVKPLMRVYSCLMVPPSFFTWSLALEEE